MLDDSTDIVGGLPPTHLRTAGLDRPWDVDTSAPLRLTWQLAATGQVAHEVRVLALGGYVAWTGARVATTDPWATVPRDALGDAQRYEWQVRVWLGTQAVSPWSAPAVFGTGPGSVWRHSNPIWAPALELHETLDWTDYDLTVTLTQGTPRVPGSAPMVGAGMEIDGAHRLGLVFRAPDLASGYVWTVDAESGALVTAVRRDGTLTELARVTIPQVSPGTPFDARVTVRGTRITTSIGGRPVHTCRDATWPAGGVGLTSPDNARCTVHRVHVATADGSILLDDDFMGGSTALAVGSAAEGALEVAERSNGLYPTQAEWAFLRGEIILDHPVLWATLFVTATSPEPARQFVYRALLNGMEVGLGPTRSVAGETRYDGFDVTDLLRSGTNAVGAIAWTTRDQRFQAELVVSFTDGTQLAWGTSAAWSALPGDQIYPTTGSIGTGYYAAPVEDLQVARFPAGFAEPGFDAAGWSPAIERKPFAELRPSPMGKVAIREYRPVAVQRLGSDAVLLDFGRTHVGGVRVRGSVDADSRVDLRYAELLDEHGRARHRLATGNTYRDTWQVPAGEVDSATWGLRVFRYVEVHGLPAEVADAVTAQGHVYPLGEPGSFSSDDTRLNEIVELCRTTMISTNLNLLVDSWSREREPYEADAYLQMRCNSAIGDDLALARYSLDYLLRRRTWPTEWPFYLVLAAWELYMRSEDEAFLRDRYAALYALLPLRWLDPETGLVRKEAGSDGSGSRMDHDIVDWPPTERDGYLFGPVNTVVNALAHGAFVAMAKIANAVGQLDDAAALTEVASRLARAMNEFLWDAQAGSYRDGLDARGEPLDHHAVHASAFAAAFGVADPDRLQSAGAMIARRGMATSVYAAPFVLEALYAAERPDDAYALIVGDGLRSWRSMIEAGAGATMEAWSESLKANVSCAHPWSASPLFIVAERVMGVRPTSPGYRTFEIRPRPGPLRTARLRLPTAAGTIGVAIQRGPSALHLEIEVPAGTSARLILPGERWVVAGLDDPSAAAERLEALGPGIHSVLARPEPARF